MKKQKKKNSINILLQKEFFISNIVSIRLVLITYTSFINLYSPVIITTTVMITTFLFLMFQ